MAFRKDEQIRMPDPDEAPNADRTPYTVVKERRGLGTLGITGAVALAASIVAIKVLPGDKSDGTPKINRGHDAGLRYQRATPATNSSSQPVNPNATTGPAHETYNRSASTTNQYNNVADSGLGLSAYQNEPDITGPEQPLDQNQAINIYVPGSHYDGNLSVHLSPDSSTPKSSKPTSEVLPSGLVVETADNHLGTQLFSSPEGAAVPAGVPGEIQYGAQVLVRCFVPNRSDMTSINDFYLIARARDDRGRLKDIEHTYAPANTFANGGPMGPNPINLDPLVKKC